MARETRFSLWTRANILRWRDSCRTRISMRDAQLPRLRRNANGKRFNALYGDWKNMFLSLPVAFFEEFTLFSPLVRRSVRLGGGRNL